jgi:hypothetical protein
MARGTLHPKKENSANRNASGLAAPTHKLQDDGKLRGPTLAKATGRSDWDADVLRWYDGWRRAPQAQVFASTDWSRLALLAPLVEKYFAEPKSATMSEIRLNEERLGATITDRMRARMSIMTEDGAHLASVAELHPGEESDEDILGEL